MRMIAAIVIAVVLGFPIVLWLGARVSLDTEMQHAALAQSLPKFSSTASDGLVRISARGMEFRARVAGFGNDGPGIILLHGFPETSIMWEPLIERAAASGFRVVAFDQRGYSPGARPESIGAYAIPELVDDVMGIADAVGFERFHLVGHDWGSIVGWNATSMRPDRVLSWASLSIPHPSAIPDPDAEPSTPFYVKVFRVDGLAETLLGAWGRLAMNTLMYSDMSQAHQDEYNAVFSEPGALAASLNWYRAMRPSLTPIADAAPVSQPVLYLYGERDVPAFVNPEVQARLTDYVAGPFKSITLDAGHWLIQDEENVVVDAVMQHLNEQL